MLSSPVDTVQLKAGLPRSEKSQGKLDFIQGQRRVREFC